MQLYLCLHSHTSALVLSDSVSGAATSHTAAPWCHNHAAIFTTQPSRCTYAAAFTLSIFPPPAFSGSSIGAEALMLQHLCLTSYAAAFMLHLTHNSISVAAFLRQLSRCSIFAVSSILLLALSSNCLQETLALLLCSWTRATKSLFASAKAAGQRRYICLKP